MTAVKYSKTNVKGTEITFSNKENYIPLMKKYRDN
jgi:hypothetical protein